MSPSPARTPFVAPRARVNPSSLIGRTLLWVVALLPALPMAAQQSGEAGATPPPRLAPADPETWGKWETAGIPVLSPEGRWLAYTVTRVNEENELRVHPVDRPDSTVVVP